MVLYFPGTTVEISQLEQGASRILFDGIFATGGITLSQVCIMTGLEPYLIQNWVKRGFVPPPVHRVYHREHFARILIINTLRDVLQIEKICHLIEVIAGAPHTREDDLISDDELYHRYVNMLAVLPSYLSSEDMVSECARSATEDFAERRAGSRAQLETILQSMMYAHMASAHTKRAEELLSTLQ